MAIRFRVAAITENYVGHFVYMNQATYQKTYGKSANMNAYLVRLQSSSQQFVQKVQSGHDGRRGGACSLRKILP